MSYLYADDTQSYLSFDSNSPSAGNLAIVQLEACISDIRQWMLENRLKRNDDKPEFLKFLIQPWNETITPSSLKIGMENIGLFTKAKNLGVLFDPSLNLTHISATCKSAFYQLHCLSRIKRYLTIEALKTPVYALISNKLDYCNSLLAGLPKGEIKRLQHIMKSAAGLVSGTKKGWIHNTCVDRFALAPCGTTDTV